MEQKPNMLDKIMEYFVFLLFFVIVIVGGLQVFFRFILNNSLTWSEELLRYLFIWMIFISIGIGFKRNTHIGMRSIIQRFSPFWQKIMEYFSILIIGIFSLAVIIFTFRVVEFAMIQVTPALGIPMGYVHMGMLIGGIYNLIVVIEKLFLLLKRDIKKSKPEVEKIC